MRAPLLAAAGALLALVLIPAADSVADNDDKGARTRPERTLTCDESRPGGCDVSCVTTSGQTLFVHDGIRVAYITEFAGSHTLLELQKYAAGDIISVLVGEISHCTLNGLRDTGLLTRGNG